MDKTRHTHVLYYKGIENVSRAVNEPRFRRLTCLNEKEQFYEVQSAKARIKLDVPIQIALSILSYGKQRIHEWHFDWLDRFVYRSDYQLLEMDTDSSYLCLSKPTLDEVVKPSMREQYRFTREGQCKDGRTPKLVFLPRTCC